MSRHFEGLSRCRNCSTFQITPSQTLGQCWRCPVIFASLVPNSDISNGPNGRRRSLSIMILRLRFPEPEAHKCRLCSYVTLIALAPSCASATTISDCCAPHMDTGTGIWAIPPGTPFRRPINRPPDQTCSRSTLLPNRSGPYCLVGLSTLVWVIGPE